MVLANILSPCSSVLASSHTVLMDIDNNNSLIVGDPQVILGKQLMPHPILI